jgi:hypothetical protein
VMEETAGPRVTPALLMRPTYKVSLENSKTDRNRAGGMQGLFVRMQGCRDDVSRSQRAYDFGPPARTAARA